MSHNQHLPPPVSVPQQIVLWLLQEYPCRPLGDPSKALIQVGEQNVVDRLVQLYEETTGTQLRTNHVFTPKDPEGS